MRILQGSLKGRVIRVPKDIRPVANIVKKACFDIMRGEIEGKRVLELFAGTGALGIEAISLGASEGAFVDSERDSVKAVRGNLEALNLSLNTKVYSKDALSAITDFHVYKEVFDIIFLDPPYHQGMLKSTLQKLEECDILAPHGYIICFCYVKDEYVADSSKFSIIVEKKYGQTLLLVYRKK
ncbi:MAG: 16S rRNA (guanine(966)-N(2))-methyltransferase RsmD [Candidatus Omnitrophota bacterium]